MGEALKYQIKMTYEREDVAALVRTMVYRQNPEKNMRMARKIGYPIFGVVLIAAGIAVPAMGALTPAGLVLTAVCIVMGLVLLRRADSRSMERRSWKRYPNKGLVMTYTFYNDHFEEEDEVSGKNEFKYVSLRNGNMDDGHYYLFTDGNMAHMLKRDSFVVGDQEQFPEFIKIRAAVTLDPVE